MTLNLSPPSIFPRLSSEEVLSSSIKLANGYVVEGCPDKNLDGLADSTWNFNWDLEDSFDYIEGKDEEAGSRDDSVSDDDILAILPDDPFGMDITATFTAITGWFEDFEKDRGSDSRGFGTDEIEMEDSDHRIFAGLNFFWDMFHPDYKKGFLIDRERSYVGGVISALNTGACMSFDQEGDWIVRDQAKEFRDCAELNSENDAGTPHDALFFALGYLGVEDLFSVERVCKSLHNAVKSDRLLWRNIHIDRPLSERITDDTLLWLTDRAQRTLQCLSLVGCLGITDSGLKRVFERSPGLTKLSVPGCVKLSVEGILYNLNALKSAGAPGVKHLRIGGIFGITTSQFEELQFLLGTNNCMQLKSHKPRFYHGGQLDVSCDDDRAFDIETCPKCQEVRLVYDCPAESCRGEHPAQLCRACTLCIARCVHCGRCINNCDYEETFCLDLLCLDCWKNILNK